MRLNGKYDDFDLNRVRLYTDLWYEDRFRFYLEYLDAVSFYEELPPRSIDEDRSDFLQLLADIKLAEPCGGPLYLRIGRQELYYGSERLMSSPDWSNVRRTFEGAKLFWKGESWDVDALWARPVPARQPTPAICDTRNRVRQIKSA